MIKRFVYPTVFAMSFLLVQPTQAQYVGPTSTPSTNVEEILANPVDDQEILLQGHLLRKVGNKEYIFSDGSAEIVVEIKAKRFVGLPEVNENTKIEINGEVDTGLYRAPKIEVDSIKILP